VAASAATTTTTASAVSDRVTEIKNALSGLVKNGSITQAQADKVATTLDSTLPQHGFGGHGGFGRGADLDTAASAIGVTADQLRTQLGAGKTLAQVAQAKGVSQATLVSKLVAAEKAEIAAKVKAGTLTRAQADTLTSGLQARITQQVTSTRPAGGHDHDWSGSTSGGGSSTTPSASPSTSATTS
jgi:hypothetical protein